MVLLQLLSGLGVHLYPLHIMLLELERQYIKYGIFFLLVQI